VTSTVADAETLGMVVVDGPGDNPVASTNGAAAAGACATNTNATDGEGVKYKAPSMPLSSFPENVQKTFAALVAAQRDVKSRKKGITEEIEPIFNE
jgi:hypothetical protein